METNRGLDPGQWVGLRVLPFSRALYSPGQLAQSRACHPSPRRRPRRRWPSPGWKARARKERWLKNGSQKSAWHAPELPQRLSTAAIAILFPELLKGYIAPAIGNHTGLAMKAVILRQ